MATQTPRTHTSFRLPTALMQGLKMEAKRQNCSLNSMVVTLLTDAMHNVPNETTKAAIRDAKEHRGLKPVDMSSFDTFLSSMGL